MIQRTERMPVGDLLSDRVPFVVPIYQRGYAWEEEEIDDFINDLLDLYHAKSKDSTKVDSHFFGGIVSVHHLVSETKAGRRYEVVDGQQRLATFVILISLIIRGLEQISKRAKTQKLEDIVSEPDSHASYTKENFLYYKEVIQGKLENLLRLTLSRSDNNVFEELVNGGTPIPSRESHKRLKNAHKTINDKLVLPILDDASIDLREKINRLLNLRDCLTEFCYVIHIISDDRTEAYRLFAILNDRGRNLSDADLLRLYTLELLQDHQSIQDEVEEYWDEILAGKPPEIDKYLRAYYTSFVGVRPPSRDFSNHFRNHFFDYSQDSLTKTKAKEIEKRVYSIFQELNAFSKISDGEWPYDNPQVSVWDRERLARLILVLKHTLSIPLLLSICKCLKEQDFSNHVNLLERFVFRYITIVGAHAGRLGEIYNKHSKAIREKSDSYKLAQLKEDLRKLLEKYAAPILFESNLKGRLAYSSQPTQRRIINYFLTTLEDFYDWFKNGAPGEPKPKDKLMVFDLRQLTIEHIYPQNATDKIADLEELKDDIGNLTFWGSTDNRAAGNDPFDKKKTRYRNSKIKLTSELANLTDWTKDSLIKRREKLIKMALKIFNI
ncbi:MAG: DUF262 domain-containing protein [Candidatus Scalindua sp.]